MFALTGLFLAAFIAATLIPAQSEAVLVALLLAETQPVWLLLSVATRPRRPAVAEGEVAAAAAAASAATISERQ